MRVFLGLPSKKDKQSCALAIGNFDGLHLGHQRLIETVRKIARERGLVPAVLTFEPHPKEFFCPEKAPERILSVRDKIELFAEAGIERLFILRFNDRLSSLSPQDFVSEILVNSLDAKEIVIGENFRFGKNGSGDPDFLIKESEKYGFHVTPVALFFQNGMKISSTAVREALRRGDFSAVNSMLGRPLCLSGKVLHGKKLGRTIGFPTINQRILPLFSKARPALRGVFAVTVRIGGVSYPGVACIGQRPTVCTNGTFLLETHIFNFRGSLYGQNVRVEFKAKIRDEKKFRNVMELQEAISRDMLEAKRILGVSF
jgi:riboflavin kinase/FMN adenylyltransferase